MTRTNKILKEQNKLHHSICNVFSVVQSYCLTYSVVPQLIYGTLVSSSSLKEERDNIASVFVASLEALSFSLRFITVFDSRLWNRSYSHFWIRYLVIQTVIPRKPWMFDYINAVWFVGLMSRSSAFSRPLSHRKAAATLYIHLNHFFLVSCRG